MDHCPLIRQHVATQLVQTAPLNATSFPARHTMDQARAAVFTEIAIQVTPTEGAACEEVDVQPSLGWQVEVREDGGDAKGGAGLVPALGAVADIDFQWVSCWAHEAHEVALASCEHLGYGPCDWVCRAVAVVPVTQRMGSGKYYIYNVF